jgi:S-DNA-T family DNA segregation ATPase FtsK/SpoIIIE
LADAIDPRYRVLYASTASEVAVASSQIAQMALQRRPPTGLDPAQLATWRPSGPKWFIVVDDFNLYSVQGSTSSLEPLVNAIKVGKQIGLHMLIATNAERFYQTGKMSKVIGAMDTVGAGVLVMDGNKQEIIVDSVRPGPRIPGRGELYYRKLGSQLVQVAMPPERTDAGIPQ